MEDTVKERLISFLKKMNISQKKFEVSIDVSNGYVNNIRQSIQPDKIQRISLRFPNLNTGWLLTGNGDMLNTEKELYDNSIKTVINPVVESSSEVSRLLSIIESQQKTIDTQNRIIVNLSLVLRSNDYFNLFIWLRYLNLPKLRI